MESLKFGNTEERSVELRLRPVRKGRNEAASGVSESGVSSRPKRREPWLVRGLGLRENCLITSIQRSKGRNPTLCTDGPFLRVAWTGLREAGEGSQT